MKNIALGSARASIESINWINIMETKEAAFLTYERWIDSSRMSKSNKELGSMRI